MDREIGIGVRITSRPLTNQERTRQAKNSTICCWAILGRRSWFNNHRREKSGPRAVINKYTTSQGRPHQHMLVPPATPHFHAFSEKISHHSQRTFVRFWQVLRSSVVYLPSLEWSFVNILLAEQQQKFPIVGVTKYYFSCTVCRVYILTLKPFLLDKKWDNYCILLKMTQKYQPTE